MPLSTTSMCLLNTSRDGDSATSLGSLFQCSITLSVKKFFLMTDLNLLWSNLRPFPQFCCWNSALTFKGHPEGWRTGFRPILPAVLFSHLHPSTQHFRSHPWNFTKCPFCFLCSPGEMGGWVFLVYCFSESCATVQMWASQAGAGRSREVLQLLHGASPACSPFCRSWNTADAHVHVQCQIKCAFGLGLFGVQSPQFSFMRKGCVICW